MRKSLITLVVVLVVIAAMTATAITGLNLGFTEIPRVQDGVRLGLDLVGGSVIGYEAEIPAGMTATELAAGMETARTMMRQRLDQLNYTEASVTIQGNNRLRVEIPNVDDPEKAVQMLGATAKLEFWDADNNVVLDGSDIKSATPKSQQNDRGITEPVVALEMTAEGTKKFADATTAAYARAGEGKNYISIVLDGEIQSQPYVQNGPITDGNAVITSGNNDPEYVKWLANIISAGQLPFTLKNIELRSVGATLGERSLQTSLMAGLIGIILVVLFMLIMYRLPGFISDIALVFYTVLTLIVIAVLKVNLSLPGIAGIILSVGMAVDANVIIYERIKEELRAGKTIRSAVDSGYKRAFTAILDSNVTTAIAAVVLWWQGTGPIIGFAQTLLIGVIVSMFTVLVVSRLLLGALVGMNVKNPRAYGI